MRAKAGVDRVTRAVLPSVRGPEPSPRDLRAIAKDRAPDLQPSAHRKLITACGKHRPLQRLTRGASGCPVRIQTIRQETQ